MTKEVLKPIDVSKYKVTETGQVLRGGREMNCIDCRYNFLKDGNYNCTYEEGECIKISVLEKENTELKEDLRNKKLGIQNRNGRIKELEEKISVLLSCKNCPENKGDLICQKEYEDKCLAQKIQYIKELQQENAELEKENAELKEDLRNKKLAIQNRNGRIKELEEENAELKEHHTSVCDTLTNTHRHIREQLTKAKEIIRELLSSCFGYNSKTVNYEVKAKAEDFLNSEV